jgi:hypothetical protein
VASADQPDLTRRSFVGATGALRAGVPEAIDVLLGAFKVTPPLIHAGGPFSSPSGSHRDDVAQFAGPVVGLQETYRSGLANVDDLSHQRCGVGRGGVGHRSRCAAVRHRRPSLADVCLGCARQHARGDVWAARIRRQPRFRGGSTSSYLPASANSNLRPSVITPKVARSASRRRVALTRGYPGASQRRREPAHAGITACQKIAPFGAP